MLSNISNNRNLILIAIQVDHNKHTKTRLLNKVRDKALNNNSKNNLTLIIHLPLLNHLKIKIKNKICHKKKVVNNKGGKYRKTRTKMKLEKTKMQKFN